eukprot:764410-Hanusia_phi.AAC.7
MKRGWKYNSFGVGSSKHDTMQWPNGDEGKGWVVSEAIWAWQARRGGEDARTAVSSGLFSKRGAKIERDSDGKM